MISLHIPHGRWPQVSPSLGICVWGLNVLSPFLFPLWYMREEKTRVEWADAVKANVDIILEFTKFIKTVECPTLSRSVITDFSAFVSVYWMRLWLWFGIRILQLSLYVILTKDVLACGVVWRIGVVYTRVVYARVQVLGLVGSSGRVL